MSTELQKQTQTPTDVPIREKHELSSSQQGTYQGPYFEPAVDIYENDQAIVMKADVPGVEAGDIDTDLRDNVLTITARVGSRDDKWKPVYEEYRVGHFTRQFRLGQQIDQMKISAELKDGVLTLTLPKADSAKPRRIEVKTA
jgi:HSP20 family protein